MTGDSQCKCTYNGGSTFEDPCKCGVCLEDPHCQMSGSVCKCTYNGGSTIEDNCKCGVHRPRRPRRHQRRSLAWQTRIA